MKPENPRPARLAAAAALVLAMGSAQAVNGGGLLLGHVSDSSVLMGLRSALFTRRP